MINTGHNSECSQFFLTIMTVSKAFPYKTKNRCKQRQINNIIYKMSSKSWSVVHLFHLRERFIINNFIFSIAYCIMKTLYYLDCKKKNRIPIVCKSPVNFLGVWRHRGKYSRRGGAVLLAPRRGCAAGKPHVSDVLEVSGRTDHVLPEDTVTRYEQKMLKLHASIKWHVQ